MTGTEYSKLSKGDVCILTENITTHGVTWHKGEKIVVAYRNTHEESIYVYNPSVIINNRPSYKKLFVLSFLKAIKVSNINTTTFSHKFNVGDTVYYMEDNKIKSSTVTNMLYYISEKGFHTLSYYLANPDSIFKKDYELFGSKKELLNSL